MSSRHVPPSHFSAPRLCLLHRRRLPIITLAALCITSACGFAVLPSEDAKHEAATEILQGLLPKGGYESMARQAKHTLGGMTIPKTEIALYPYNLGPTGILAERNTKTLSYKVSGTMTGGHSPGLRPCARKLPTKDSITTASTGTGTT